MTLDELKGAIVDAINDGFNNLNNNSGNNNNNNPFGEPTGSNHYGRYRQQKLFDTALFNRLNDELTGLTEEINNIRTNIDKENKVIKEAEKASKELGRLLKKKGRSKKEKEVYERTRSEKEVIDINIELLKLEQKYRAQDNNLRAEELKFKRDNFEKLKAINKTQREARLKQQEWELKGYKKDGKKKSNAEAKALRGQFAQFKEENTFGRRFGEYISKGISRASKGLNMINSGKMDVGAIANGISSGLSKLGPYGAAAGGIVQIFKSLFDMYGKVDKAASDYSRTVGGGRATMERMKTSMSSMALEMTRQKGIYYDADDLMKTMAEYSGTLGRNLEYMSSLDITAIEDLKKFGIDGGILSEFDTFGMSVQTVSEKIKEMYAESGKRGLNAKAVTDAMTKNLKLAQTYNFQNGLRGLESMARKAVEVKLNMQQVASFAEKVSTLEGAMQTGANLSVLGGSFARFGNPLQMLYEGLNDMEGLQDRVINMFGDLGKFDYSKGHIDVSVFNKQRIKAASQQMGMDYGEVMKMIDTNARRNAIAGQLRGGLDKETEDYIKNVATLDKNGMAQVTFNQGTNFEYTKSVSELTNADKAKLKKESEDKAKIEGADMGSILKSTLTIQDYLDRLVGLLKDGVIKWLMKIGGMDEKTMAAANKYGIYDFEGQQELAQGKRKAGYTGAAIAGTAGIAAGGALGGLGGAAFGGVVGAGAGYLTGIWAYDEEKHAKEIARRNKRQNKNKEYSNGGYITGPGTTTSDSIPARLSNGEFVRLSNGEFVVNAAATAKNRSTLEKINAQGYAGGGIVRPIKNQLKNILVSAGRNFGSGMARSTQIGSGAVSVNINVGGTVKIDANGFLKNVPASEWLTKETIDYIIREISVQSNKGLNKDKGMGIIWNV